jgi:hypothetical protein
MQSQTDPGEKNSSPVSGSTDCRKEAPAGHYHRLYGLSLKQTYGPICVQLSLAWAPPTLSKYSSLMVMNPPKVLSTV